MVGVQAGPRRALAVSLGRHRHRACVPEDRFDPTVLREVHCMCGGGRWRAGLSPACRAIASLQPDEPYVIMRRLDVLFVCVCCVLFVCVSFSLCVVDAVCGVAVSD
jgi:hypothetical protein